MFKIIKKDRAICAYRLGEYSKELAQLMAEGKIIQRDESTYEIFSEEAVAGKSGKGEIAHSGDYVKISVSGFPYPNKRQFFEAGHTRIAENLYKPIPKQLDAWTVSEPPCEEINFLLQNNRLHIDPTDKQRYFRAHLWGTDEAAPQDAVVVFYAVHKKGDEIVDVEFNFIVKSEFELFYDICAQ